MLTLTPSLCGTENGAATAKLVEALKKSVDEDLAVRRQQLS